MNSSWKKRLLLLFIFSSAFGFVESSVVVYLRAIYYPDGFSFPLKIIHENHLYVELMREAATIVMLFTVGILAGENKWERFSYFIFSFGVWDIFYYVWLKVILDWPQTIYDWDILFLIPLPWIGPVIAPVFISLFLIASAVLILRKEGHTFHPSYIEWPAVIVGSGAILFSFMEDTAATIQLAMPKPYSYRYLWIGLLLYCFALLYALRTKHSG